MFWYAHTHGSLIWINSLTALIERTHKPLHVESWTYHASRKNKAEDELTNIFFHMNGVHVSVCKRGFVASCTIAQAEKSEKWANNHYQ